MNTQEIVRAACGTLGLPAPNSATGSSDTQVIQLLGLLNKEGRKLSGETPWQALTAEASFATVAAQSQGTLTSIIGSANAFRYILNDTIFNRTRREPIFGPKSSREWQAQKSMNLTGPWPQYRIRGGLMLFDPTPTAGESCYFEYVTRNWVESSDGVAKRSYFAADEDVSLLDSDLLLAGVEWRWLAKKGLDYAQEFKDYAEMVADAKARDATKRTLFLDGQRDRFRPGVFISGTGSGSGDGSFSGESFSF